jgi:hypothetical protein
MILLMSATAAAQNKVWTNEDLDRPISRPAAKPDLTGLIHHQYKEVPEIKPGPGYYVIHIMVYVVLMDIVIGGLIMGKSFYSIRKRYGQYFQEIDRAETYTLAKDIIDSHVFYGCWYRIFLVTEILVDEGDCDSTGAN